MNFMESALVSSKSSRRKACRMDQTRFTSDSYEEGEGRREGRGEGREREGEGGRNRQKKDGGQSLKETTKFQGLCQDSLTVAPSDSVLATM